MTYSYKPGDIFLTKGTSFISRAIRFFSRSGGESRTEVNHVGIVWAGGDSGNTVIIEALSTVKKRNFSVYRTNPRHDVAVFRPQNLSEDEVTTVITKADTYVGRDYGYVKIVAHLIDYFFGGRYVARRLTNVDKYPICSWVVAKAYAEAGKDFGVDPGAASPDDIWDFVKANPDKYEQVLPLGNMP